MIQDIHPHRLDMTYAVRDAAPDDLVVALRGNAVLVVDDGDGVRLPSPGEAARVNREAGERLFYLFSVDGTALHMFDGDIGADAGEAPGFRLMDVQKFRGHQPEWQSFVGVTASHLGQWYAMNRFCGGCGSAMRRKTDERAVQCPQCGVVIYPRISPAVIVGVVDGDRILMTRYANRPNNNQLTALIAGFMEVGETLEDTIRREVGEEVGVAVKNIRYYKSQPWGFSSSILVGFYADLDGSADITIDTGELQEAVWVSRGELKPNDATFSLTSEMVEMFRRDRFPR